KEGGVGTPPYTIKNKINTPPYIIKNKIKTHRTVCTAFCRSGEREGEVLVEPGLGECAIAETQVEAQIHQLLTFCVDVEEGAPAPHTDDLQRVHVGQLAARCLHVHLHRVALPEI